MLNYQRVHLLYLFFYGQAVRLDSYPSDTLICSVEIKITAHHNGTLWIQHLPAWDCELRFCRAGVVCLSNIFLVAGCTRPECFGMCHPTYFQDVFLAPIYVFWHFSALVCLCITPLVPETQAAKGPHGPRSEVIRRSRPPWAMHRAVWMKHILLRASAQDAACRWGIRWGMGHPP